ncbi:MAG: hypothetical protein EXR77_09995 [Myxococcales bacterium]|nr:hypothetical protein [Myxococcales bacterium]
MKLLVINAPPPSDANQRMWRGYVAIGVIAMVVHGGCLATSYEVPRDEVERLVQAPADQRGRNIRAVQRFSISRDLTPAPAWGQPGDGVPGSAPIVAVPVSGASPLYHGWYPNYYGWGNPYYAPTIFVGDGGGGSASGGDVAGGTPAGRGGVSSASSSSSVGPALGKADRDSARALVVVVIIGAIVIGAVLAGSEGARYDGTVAVHPHHPVHLLGDSGDRHVPLDELRLSDIRNDDQVILEGNEGAGMWLRGRAPLNRPGFVYSMGGGYSGLQLANNTLVSGGSAELGLGVFTSEWLGLVARFQFIDGVQSGSDFIGIRTGAEVQALPIDLGRLHLGGYGGLAYEWAKGSGGAIPFTDDDRLAFSAGAMVELEWTTRLAVYFRYGVQSALVGADTGAWLTGAAFGLTIY